MIEGPQAVIQKAVYMLGNVVCLGLAVYKCQVMGLLPTTTSDWLAFVEAQKVGKETINIEEPEKDRLKLLLKFCI